MSAFAYKQPPFSVQDGHLVLFCEHCTVNEQRITLAGRFHWFWIVGDPDHFTEEDCIRLTNEETGKVELLEAHWIALCEICFNDALRDDLNPIDKVRQHARWIGDSPTIDAPTVQ